MILKIIIIILGLTFVIGSFFYTKEGHEKHAAGGSGSAAGSGTADSIIVLVLFLLVGFILSITPYYVMRSLIFLFGAGLIGVAIAFL